MYKLTDFRNPNVRRLYYSEDKNELELLATDIMDSIKHLLPSGAWKQGGWAFDPDNLEYEDRNEVGTGRVYVRISKTKAMQFCGGCGKPAQYQTRSGFYCGGCIDSD